jgi:hypothetical protein
MRRTLAMALLALGWAARAPAGDYGGCQEPPEPAGSNCCSPYEHRRFLCLTLFAPCHAERLLEQLKCDNARQRLRIIKKLGCRLHADFCLTPEVLDALTGTLLCDSCWEVREAAAWAILGQKAQTDGGVLALYLSSKLDPHYMVRARAAEALDILTVCRRGCFEELYKSADALIEQLRCMGYRPGMDGCQVQLVDACSGCHMAPIVASPDPSLPLLDESQLRLGPATTPGAEGEKLGPPRQVEKKPTKP